MIIDPQPGDVLEHDGMSKLIVLVLRRYPLARGEKLGEEVEVLWLIGHTNQLTSKHRACIDTWWGWKKL